jgi:hypothetical protein
METTLRSKVDKCFVQLEIIKKVYGEFDRFYPVAVIEKELFQEFNKFGAGAKIRIPGRFVFLRFFK